VSAYAARGEPAVAQLLALNPVGPIAAEIWHARGNDLRKSDDVEHSIHAFEQALVLRGGDLEGQVRELVALAERHDAKGDTRQTLALHARAFEVATQLGDPITLANVRVALAVQLDLLGDLDGSERALGDSIEHLPTDDAGYLPSALNIHGVNAYFRGHYRLARELLTRASQLPDKEAANNAHRNLIDVALAMHDLDEAARLVASDPVQANSPGHDEYVARVELARGHLDTALTAIDRGLSSPRLPQQFQPEFQSIKGEILAKRGERPAAITTFTQSIDGYDAQLDGLGIDELKAFAQQHSQRREPYEHLFALYARGGDALEALHVVQRATARAYLDGLVATNTAPSDDVATLARAAGVRIEALHVIARSLRSSKAPPPLSPTALVAGLDGAIVWSYFAAEGEAWLIAVDRGRVTIDDLGEMATLEPLIDRASNLDETALARLGAALSPSQRWAEISPSAVIHIAASPPFDRVPFGALGRNTSRWIEQGALSYVPSATVLAELLRRGGDDRSVLVLGDPLGDLPGARAEAIATAQRFNVVPKLGSTATREVLFSGNHAALLAVASHAEATPLGARLRLADRDVTTADILDHALAPELVMLATCASASVGTDPWGALAGAFLAAGTPNVIASRWALDDRASRELVARFYAADGIHAPAVALAIAQREAISHQVPVSTWAALVALGTGVNDRKKGLR
jgi:tetratricopeptide (TPR) repeat protein